MNITKRKFSKELLQGLVWGDHDETFEVISNDIAGTSRWSIHHKMVFKFDGKFYRTTYSVGATESQDEGPYEYEGELVECYEVHPVSKTVIVYENVKA